MNELYFFWGENYLITIHSSEMSWLTNYFKQEKNGTIKKSPQSVDQLLYAILQNVVSQMRPIMSNIRYGIEKIDDNYGNERPEDVIKQISELRRNIIFLQSSLKPQKNIFAAFEQMKDQQEKNMDAYWGNIGDFLGKMMDMAEDDQELLEGLYSSIDTLLTFRTNKIMKILAMITVISLPLTTISGFYGMNIPLPFQNSINAIWGIISVMVIFCVIAVVLLIKINKN
jgi:magnesium transporter